MTGGDAPEGRRRSTGLIARAERALERWYAPFDQTRPATPPQSLGGFFLWAYQGIGWPLAALFAASLAIGFIEVAIMAGVGELVDRARDAPGDAFFSENAWFLAGMVGLMLIARPLAITLLGLLGGMVVTPGIAPGLIWRLHRHVLGHSMRFFEDDFAGRIAQKEMQASFAVDSITADAANAVGMLLSFLIGMTVALSFADWRLGLFALLWAACYALVLRATLPPIRRAARRRAEARAAATGQLVDAVANIKTVKIFARPGAEEAAAEDTLARYRRAAIDVGREVTILRAALNFMNGVVMTAMLGVALFLWSSGQTTIGVVAAASMLAFRLTHMSGWIAFTFLGVFREIGTLEDALETLAKPHELTDRKRPHAPPPLSARAGAPDRIVFDAVSFSYRVDFGGPVDGAPAPPAALHNLSLAIEPGEKIGLVGPSGAGKSTLAALLLRLYDVEQGRISIGGADIRALPQTDLRARISVVTQEAALFNRSALDNIRYGQPEATPEEAREAAKRARADGFIQDLADIKGRRGYAAHLGERGVKLSGGQRQRIALARAVLKDAPILVLDEATSALDSETEAAILDSLRDLMRGKTVIAIAHRLSTLAEMDRIIVLNDGRIVEEGAHEALLAAEGLYADLWSRQSGGFIATRAAAE